MFQKQEYTQGDLDISYYGSYKCKNNNLIFMGKYSSFIRDSDANPTEYTSNLCFMCSVWLIDTDAFRSINSYIQSKQNQDLIKDCKQLQCHMFQKHTENSKEAGQIYLPHTNSVLAECRTVTHAHKHGTVMGNMFTMTVF